MCFLFYSQAVDGSGIARQPFFNHPYQSLLLRGLYFHYAGISFRNLLRNRPFYVFVEKWVLTQPLSESLDNGLVPRRIAQRNGNIA